MNGRGRTADNVHETVSQPPCRPPRREPPANTGCSGRSSVRTRTPWPSRIGTAGSCSSTRPGLGVLYLSGHTDDEVFRRGGREGSADFLPKPFTPATPAAAVRGLLDRPRPAG